MNGMFDYYLVQPNNNAVYNPTHPLLHVKLSGWINAQPVPRTLK
jgi:hypothetical protein